MYLFKNILPKEIFLQPKIPGTQFTYGRDKTVLRDVFCSTLGIRVIIRKGGAHSTQALPIKKRCFFAREVF